MSEVFSDYGNYYDLLYADNDYGAESQYVVSKLRELQPGIQSVLEFGCGTGRHGRLMARAGFDMVGIERSPTMLAQSVGSRTEEDSVFPGTFTAVEGDVGTRTVPGAFDAAMDFTCSKALCY